MHKRAIVVQGAPGVGKTTLARRLAEDLSIKLIAKDDIKEGMYDKIGHPKDRAESELYGRMAIRAMYAGLDEYLKSGQKVMIEAPLIPTYATEDLSGIVSLDRLLQVHVYCDPHTLEDRFRDRVASGNRHKGHSDVEIDAVEALKRNDMIPGIETIKIDTSNFSQIDYTALLEIVNRKMNGGNNETTN